LDRVNDDAAPARSEAVQRSGRVVLLAAFVGVLTGLGVAVFDEVVTRGLDGLADLPLWVIALAPTLGLAVASLALWWIGRGASRAHQQQVEAALHKFEQFQLCRS